MLAIVTLVVLFNLHSHELRKWVYYIYTISALAQIIAIIVLIIQMYQLSWRIDSCMHLLTNWHLDVQFGDCVGYMYWVAISFTIMYIIVAVPI